MKIEMLDVMVKQMQEDWKVEIFNYWNINLKEKLLFRYKLHSFRLPFMLTRKSLYSHYCNELSNNKKPGTSSHVSHSSFPNPQTFMTVVVNDEHRLKYHFS